MSNGSKVIRRRDVGTEGVNNASSENHVPDTSPQGPSGSMADNQRVPQVSDSTPMEARGGAVGTGDQGDASPATKGPALEELADMAPEDFGALMDSIAGQARQVRRGDRVTGKVVRIAGDQVFIDLNGKSEASMDLAEFEPGEAEIGAMVEARVLTDGEDGVVLSRRLRGGGSVEVLEAARAAGIPVEGRVESRNAGGYLVQLSGTRGFCPTSQIHRFPGKDLDRFVGMELTFRITEIGDREVVLSHRAIQEEEVKELRARFWSNTKPGDVVEGVVTSVRDYGAFVDVGGIEGLVHKSELGWETVQDPTTVISRWDNVRVKVLELDKARQRVALSLRLPEYSPWLNMAQRFPVDSVHAGKVVKVTDFGAFVELAPGIQGLVRIGNLSWDRVEHPSDVVHRGQKLQVKVLEVNEERRRLDLGLRQTTEDPLQAMAARYPVGAEVDGVVQQVSPKGVTLLVDDEVAAWLPGREVALPPGVVLQQRVRKGARLKARVVDLDRRRRQLQLTQTEASDAEDVAAREQMKSAAKAPTNFGTFADLLKNLKLD